MPTKSEYNREYHNRRYNSDPEFRAKKIATRSRTPEENKAYMREYYQRTKHTRKPRTPEQREKHLAARRQKYASDEAFREARKLESRQHRIKYPDRAFAADLKQYGLTPEQYTAIYDQQGGRCAICGSEAGDRISKRFHIDHCHATGVVRGLLCSSCNLGLGKFKDDVARLIRAVEYLQRQR